MTMQKSRDWQTPRWDVNKFSGYGFMVLRGNMVKYGSKT